MASLTVRRTVEDDWMQVRALRLEMLADTPIAYLETLAHAKMRGEAEWRSWAREGSSAGAITLAAITGEGRWVGTMISKIPYGAQTPYLFGVYVSPDHRGTAAGVLDAMLTPIEEWARERGDTLTLEVSDQNARARAAYANRGFVETGVSRPDPLARRFRELEMVKRLR
jgi:GNAT superfamily N-acetyltransferase